jgi:hypothetical protein
MNTLILSTILRGNGSRIQFLIIANLYPRNRAAFIRINNSLSSVWFRSATTPSNTLKTLQHVRNLILTIRIIKPCIASSHPSSCHLKVKVRSPLSWGQLLPPSWTKSILINRVSSKMQASIAWCSKSWNSSSSSRLKVLTQEEGQMGHLVGALADITTRTTIKVSLYKEVEAPSISCTIRSKRERTPSPNSLICFSKSSHNSNPIFWWQIRCKGIKTSTYLLPQKGLTSRNSSKDPI